MKYVVRVQLEHSDLVVLLVSLLLVEHEVDEEERAEQRGLHAHVQVHGEADAEVVRVRERLAQHARPLLRYLADLSRAIWQKQILMYCYYRTPYVLISCTNNGVARNK